MSYSKGGAQTALNCADDRGAPRPISAVRRERTQSLPTSHAVPTRIRRDIIDGKQNPPLATDAQTRRMINEVGRSRSGADAIPTNNVVLERNPTVMRALSASHTNQLTQRVEGVTRPAGVETCQSGLTDFPPLGDGIPLAPPSYAASYAAAVAKPFDYQLGGDHLQDLSAQPTPLSHRCVWIPIRRDL
ncbi:hypothetical protein C8Q79DRAFT_754212 [Trametes meyenii]|nr:hypothetical protein C8Q79DRAFT_754212 [Trametes meyenii]